MKLVRGISLFIISLGLLVVGGYLGFASHEFFYPGTSVQGNSQNTQESIQMSKSADGKMQASVQEENVITADTSFVVIEVNVEDQSEKKEEIPVPAYYMGMDLKDFETQIQTQDASPSLTELKKGFQGSEIRSFSNEKVELCKFYQLEEEEKNDFFYLAIQENKVVVYRSDGKTVYMETDIHAEELPEDILQELLQRRIVNTEEDLYDFLESYSS